jgi:hypothetical protein
VSRLSKISNSRDFKDAVWHADAAVLEVSSPHALSRAAGYLKYADNSAGGVYFRGQTKLYPKMVPSLYRSVKQEVAGSAPSPRASHQPKKRRKATTDKTNQEMRLNALLKSVTKSTAFLSGTPEYAHEPLLQHYGIQTRWLDVVDNVWTALWFACHEAATAGERSQYLHYVRSQQVYAYIVLIQAGMEMPVSDQPGMWNSDKAKIIDLRRAAPSLYLRPHAQHGLLVRRRAYVGNSSIDRSDMVAGVIRIKRDLATAWLGTGELTTVHHVFPPPVYDFGYKRLLESAPTGDGLVGTIQHIGA